MAKWTLSLRIKLLRPINPTYTMKSYIGSITNFVDSMRIILTQPVSQALNTSLLQLCSSTIELTSACNSTKLMLNVIVSSLLLETNLTPFYSKILENSPYLWSISRQKLSGISNISRKKYKIKLFTYNISKPSWWNLIFSVLLLKTYYVNIFTKTLSFQLGYKSLKKAKILTFGTI